jgi:hypothetical protein
MPNKSEIATKQITVLMILIEKIENIDMVEIK